MTFIYKARKTLSNLQERIATLSATVYEAEDEVFALFCRKIGVANIREYEEQQLKVAQEESQARLRFDTQIARLSNQYVLKKESYLSTFSSKHLFSPGLRLRTKVSHKLGSV